MFVSPIGARDIVGNVRRIHPKRDLAIVELTTPLDEEILPLASSDNLDRNNQSILLVFRSACRYL